MDKKSKNFIISFIIFLILSILIYFYLLKTFSNSKFYFNYILSKLNFLNVSILLLLLILYFLFDGLRLYFIILSTGHSIPVKLLVKLIFANVFISNITPFSSGGGFIQIYYLNKANIAIGEATAITSIRTVLAMFFFLTLTPLILIFDKSIDKIVPAKTVFLYALIFMITYITIFYFIIQRKNLIKKLIYKIFYLLKKLKLIKKNKFKKWVLYSFKEINFLSFSIKKYLFGNKIFVIFSILFTLFFLTLLFSFTPFLLNLLNIKYNLLEIYIYQLIITFIMYFVPTPGSSGVAEAGYAYIFKTLLPVKYIPTLTILWRFLTIYVGMFIGLIIVLLDIIKSNINKIK